jgi:ferredoxin-NADP reductase
VIASTSKYLLAFRQRHVFNPAAIAAVVMSIAVPSAFPGWWVGTPWLMPVTVVAAFVILYRTRHLSLGIVFAVVATVTVAAASAANGSDVSTALVNALGSTPVIFFAGFMLSEPLTLPPRRWQQLVEAVLVGVLFGMPLHFGPVYGSYELALVVGNLLAFLVGQRRGIRLTFVGRKRLTPTTWELSFRPQRPVAYAAGQYMELSLPHAKADLRGQRRVFSIASAVSPGAPDEPDLVRFGLKTATPSSSFKTALLGLEPGDTLRGTGVGGDFVLPGDAARPLLLVAGGIGITPFASQLPAAAERDVVLVYSVSSPDEIAYRDVLARAGVRILLVSPTDPGALPADWTYAGPGPLSEEHLELHVPDAARRHAYVSGSPRLVHEVRRTLRRSGVRRITTDAFSGY